MKRIECVANFNKWNKIKATLKNPACVINVCRDKIIMLPMPLKVTGNIVLPTVLRN